MVANPEQRRKAEIVPTVTAYTPEQYQQQLQVATSLSQRISLDFMDGVFTPAKSLNLIQAHWPPQLVVDLHLMYQQPLEHLETLISMKPQLVVVHAEASGELLKLLSELQAVGIRVGVAFLQSTDPTGYGSLLEKADHALIFSGQLGQFGGQADLNLLRKVTALRAANPQLEISWDGGINEDNAAQIVQGGVDVLNVGGYLQQASDPQIAYDTLKNKLQKGN